MPLDILSLDLDWFNFSERGDIHASVDDFFSRLKKECVLPHTIYVAQEHQYLYPWSVNLLNRKWRRSKASGSLTYRKMRIVNIDEHHDFYYLDELDLHSMSSEVDCGNFFAHMVHEGLLSEYTWVIDGDFTTEPRKNLNSYLSGANSKSVKCFGRTIKIASRNSVFSVLRNRKFDGFIIVKSPEFVVWRDVYAAVDEVLARLFSGYRFQRCQRRRNFVRRETKKIGNKLFAR